MGDNHKERRRFSRVDARLVGGLHEPLKKVPENTIITRNISESGLYCDCEVPFEVFTIVQLRLLVSFPKPSKGKTQEIICEGIVVRCAEDGHDSSMPYAIAIHFLDVSERDRDLLRKLVAMEQAKKN